MTKIAAKEFTNIAMVNGNEKLYRIVIDTGMLKEWVGIGWIKLRKAVPSDYKKMPEVDRESQ